MKKKIFLVVQARTNSKRLKSKILLKIFDKTIFEILLERIKKIKNFNKILIATTKRKQDDEIVFLAKKNSIKVFRGSEKNVLKRFYDTLKNIKPSVIIRITADCPLIDWKYVDELINFYLKNDYDYVSNFYSQNLPEGFYCEVFNFKSLAKTYRDAKNDFDKEHVTSFMWKNPYKFKIHHYKTMYKIPFLKNLRLTLDYKEDYKLIKIVVEHFYKKKKFFSLVDIINFLKKNRNLMLLNNKYILNHQKKYQKRRLNIFKKYLISKK